MKTGFTPSLQATASENRTIEISRKLKTLSRLIMAYLQSTGASTANGFRFTFKLRHIRQNVELRLVHDRFAITGTRCG